MIDKTMLSKKISHFASDLKSMLSSQNLLKTKTETSIALNIGSHYLKGLII